MTHFLTLVTIVRENIQNQRISMRNKMITIGTILNLITNVIKAAREKYKIKRDINGNKFSKKPK